MKGGLSWRQGAYWHESHRRSLPVACFLRGACQLVLEARSICSLSRTQRQLAVRRQLAPPLARMLLLQLSCKHFARPPSRSAMKPVQPKSTENGRKGQSARHIADAMRLGGAEEISAEAVNEEFSAAKQFWAEVLDRCVQMQSMTQCTAVCSATHTHNLLKMERRHTSSLQFIMCQLS